MHRAHNPKSGYGGKKGLGIPGAACAAAAGAKRTVIAPIISNWIAFIGDFLILALASWLSAT
jgi:hypothetical protein